MSKSLNIMLVHGAWADGSCWSKVILLLQAKGYNVTAAQIPLKSLQDDIEVTRRLLSAQTGPTVLVGHSYGGAVITGTATATPQVKALVYITAFGLDEGESLESLSKQGPPSPGSAAIEPDDKGFLWINREKFHKSCAGGATDAEAAIMAGDRIGLARSRRCRLETGAETLDIAAGTETPAGAAQHQTAQAGIGGDFVHQGGQLVDHLLGEGIAALRAIEGDMEMPALARDEQRLPGDRFNRHGR